MPHWAGLSRARETGGCDVFMGWYLWFAVTRFRGMMTLLVFMLVDQPHSKIEGFLIANNQISHGIFDRMICLRSSRIPALARTKNSCRQENGRVHAGCIQPLTMKLSRDDGVSIDDLLCQRAVQTQLYYFAEFRDGWVQQDRENSANSAVSAPRFKIFPYVPLFSLYDLILGTY